MPRSRATTTAGGLTKHEEATPEVQGYCLQIKKDAEIRAGGSSFKDFTAKSFRTQQGDGGAITYFVKIHVGDEKYVHVKMTKGSDGKVSMKNVQKGHSKHDRIDNF